MYTFQYDLESVWWIVLWTLLARVAHWPGQEYAFTIYVNKLENTPERQRIFLKRGHLLSKLKEKLHTELSPFAEVMEDACTDLWRAYIDREKNGHVREPLSYAEIHVTMMGSMVKCMDCMREGMPSLVSLHPQGVTELAKPATTDGTGASKRSRSDDDNRNNLTSDKKRPRLAGRRLFQ